MRLWCCGVAGAEELRDPFVFGSVQVQARETAPPSAPSVGLSGILWDAQSPLAIIGGEPVGVGEIIEGWRIVEIRPDRVILERNGQRTTLLPGGALPTE